ncbi:hypothetical protein RP20_CCG012267 [Aedes albopictus]|nr:hypothetical protein RP20_CCG012267 [Aedes albopictus]
METIGKPSERVGSKCQDDTPEPREHMTTRAQIEPNSHAQLPVDKLITHYIVNDDDAGKLYYYVFQIDVVKRGILPLFEEDTVNHTELTAPAARGTLTIDNDDKNDFLSLLSGNATTNYTECP